MIKSKINNKLACGLLLLGLAPVAWASDYQVRPMETGYAKTLSGVTVDGWFESFTGVELDEVEDFDGWTAGLDLTIPFMERFQVILSIPVRTEGDAVVKDDHWIMPGEDIDIEGNGGVFDFVSLSFEHQLFHEKADGYNLSYYVGYGGVADALDTGLVRPNGIDDDKINHNGRNLFAGVKVDDDRWGVHMLGNLGLRYYESDDLFPGGDEAILLDLKGAVIFNPWGERLYPVLELTYMGDFSDVNQITLIPELIYAINPDVELKAGMPIGLGGTGNEFGGQAELSVRF